MQEVKYIPGTDYLVYNDGRIWSNKTHRFMKQCSNGQYLKVALCIKGKLKQFLVHRSPHLTSWNQFLMRNQTHRMVLSLTSKEKS